MTVFLFLSSDALETLESELQTESQQREKLKEEHNKSLQDLEEKERRHRDQLERLKNSQSQIKELSRELDTKNDLVSGICQHKLQHRVYENRSSCLYFFQV